MNPIWVSLYRQSPADTAHRFAVTFHTQLHTAGILAARDQERFAGIRQQTGKSPRLLRITRMREFRKGARA